MTDQLPAVAAPDETELDAYALLSKPTLALTDAEVAIVVADLRKRRETFLKTGKPDKPRAEAKAKADPLSPEAKKANTLALLAQLTLGPPAGGNAA